MGVDLLGTSGQKRLDFGTWADVQILAVAHGWTPAGTEGSWEQDRRPRGYDYNSNNGQWVTPVDAASMAAALRRASTGVVDDSTLGATASASPSWPGSVLGRPASAELEGRIRSAKRRFSGPGGRASLQRIADFCDAGGFRIC